MLEDLKVLGYNGFLVKEYNAVVTPLRNIRTLHISPYSMRHWETDSFLNEEELLQMLLGFRKIEQLALKVLPGSSGNNLVNVYCEKRGIKLILFN
jgi:hypothetical protein